ncbi:MAG: bifunctional glutamate N-acetyltransferase/amino-acid acetyltransferase ArgJ [Dehalococcoidales bacterium]|jgi:glutamate N-acetyltransferase/amino-acid N-acetyltransferase|nr:bifunctional glutamate N-acetyltransferase/amino-acid acetyltransferase ArgJ [Dehalococcoidales bacterium]
MEAEIELIPEGTVTSARGFQAGATFASINKKAKYNLDLGILFSEAPSVAVGLFTTNKIKAAPVVLCQKRLPSKSIKAVVVNSGLANAGTGEQGFADAISMAALAAKKIEVQPESVLVASTGVIGQRLNLELLRAGIARVTLSGDGGHALAQAMLTTDTVTKEVAVRVKGNEFIIGGVAKGSGMIHPRLGTLLSLLTTDAAVDMDFLSTALRNAVDISFNMVSIDGDTSPNDTVLLMANGLADNGLIKQRTKSATAFQRALNQVCIYLAKAIARDGEGAGRLIEVTVSGALSLASARSAARTIASSPLVKAAVHGSDPNWGRIIAALGRSGAEVVESKISLSMSGIRLVEEGIALPFDVKKAVLALNNDEVSISINLNLGRARATAWGCDLSSDYVTINSQYTT